MGGVRAGSLDRKLEVYKLVTVQDDAGQEVKSLTLDFYAWGRVNYIRGKEKMQYGREEIQIELATFKVRFTSRLTATHKFKFNGNYWDIQSMAPMGRLNREFIEAMCEHMDVSKIVLP